VGFDDEADVPTAQEVVEVLLGEVEGRDEGESGGFEVANVADVVDVTATSSAEAT
jgi:hypothetical protein